jgi:hypothetical protein
MLPALLPFLEAILSEGAVGGTAAGMGSGAGAGGMLRGLLSGGAKAFGSEAELGSALRKISDLSQTVTASQHSLAHNQQRQEEISTKAREDEAKYAFADPAHTKQLSDLARQQQQHIAEMRAAQRQMNDLQYRATITTDPQAARAATLGQAAGVIGAGALVQQFAPTFIRNHPLVQMGGNAAQVGANTAQNFMGPTQGAIVGQAAGFAQKTAGIAGQQFNPMTGANPLKAMQNASEMAVQISKLPAHIMDWSQALVDSQKTISRFSGVLQQTFAQAERREIVRGIESAGRTGGATSDLSDSLQDLYDLIQPVKDTVTIVIARTLTSGLQILQEMVGYVKGAYELLKMIAPTFGVAANVAEGILERMEEESRQKASVKMQPLVKALQDLQREDPRRPRSVPRR